MKKIMLLLGISVLFLNLFAKNNSLIFNPNILIKEVLITDKDTLNFRSCYNLIYVSSPVDSLYQSMNIFIPEAYFNNGIINGYNSKTAPIFLPNEMGGYMPALAGKIRSIGIDHKVNTISEALKRGYIVASPAVRGRTNQDKNGTFTGKAPACIVDIKSAVKYLKFNDSVMPGDADKIISNGTSAGGALSALLGASGNSSEFDKYFLQLGAANASDDIFAVSAYCPITNLENADMAYEWQMNGIYKYKKLKISVNTDYKIERSMVSGNLNQEQISNSLILAKLFPDYLNSLKLTDENSNNLTLDKNGNGTFKNYLISLLSQSAQSEINKGNNLSSLDWITISNNQITNLDYLKYLNQLGRMKTVPAFDDLDLNTGENQLFGDNYIDKKHFTQFSVKNSKSKGQKADDILITIMNPMHYLINNNAAIASHWRIRHGSKDNDTSLAIPAILSLKLKNINKNVDFAFAWDKPHSGDYDLDD